MPCEYYLDSSKSSEARGREGGRATLPEDSGGNLAPTTPTASVLYPEFHEGLPPPLNCLLWPVLTRRCTVPRWGLI